MPEAPTISGSWRRVSRLYATALLRRYERERGLSLLPGAGPIPGAPDTPAASAALGSPTGEWGKTAGLSSFHEGRRS